MIKTATLWNWNLEVLDENGNQIPKYQGNYDDIGTKFLEASKDQLIVYYLANEKTGYKMKTNRWEFEALLDMTPEKIRKILK